jgi:hypothetical protein
MAVEFRRVWRPGQALQAWFGVAFDAFGSNGLKLQIEGWEQRLAEADEEGLGNL